MDPLRNNRGNRGRIVSVHSEKEEASQTPFGFARVDRSRQRRLWRSSESSEKFHRVAFESDS